MARVYTNPKANAKKLDLYYDEPNLNFIWQNAIFVCLLPQEAQFIWIKKETFMLYSHQPVKHV